MSRLRHLGAAAVSVLVLLGVFGATGGARAADHPTVRYASLASDLVNVRAGPGTQYPIRWVYERAGLPIRIVDELDVWRKIEDYEGSQGWIRVNLLSPARTALITAPVVELRRSPDDRASVTMLAEQGVVAKFIEDAGSWCRVEIDRRRGWTECAGLWGVD